MPVEGTLEAKGSIHENLMLPESTCFYVRELYYKDYEVLYSLKGELPECMIFLSIC